MKKRIPREAKIGFFGIAMAVLLYLGINFIKSKKLFSNDHIFYVEYSQADGLEVSSPVLIKGFRVGTVEKISFDIHKSTIIVKFSVGGDYPIPNDSQAKIASTSLLGGKVLEIVLGRSSTHLENDTFIKSTKEEGLLQMAGDEYEKLKESASTIIEELNTALSSVNSLLNAENIKNIGGVISNLNTMSADLSTMMSQEKKNISTLIADLNTISSTLSNEMPRLSGTLANVNKLSADLSQSVPDLMSNATLALGNLNGTLAKIESGKGLLGKMVNDDELYTSFNQTVGALTLLLEDLKTNPKRYVHFSLFAPAPEKNKKK